MFAARITTTPSIGAGSEQPGRRLDMAVIVIQEFEATTDQYDQVNEKLGGEVPDGLIAHAGAESGSGKWKVVDIWESKEKWESFLNGRLGEAVDEVMGPPPEGAEPPKFDVLEAREVMTV